MFDLSSTSLPRGTEGSNPSSSSGESIANLFEPEDVGPAGRRSLVFKMLQVVLFFDKQRNVLVYVAYSDRIIEGSPKNSISSVPIMSWPEP